MKAIPRERFKISEEAAQWLIRLQDDRSLDCQAEFTAWSRKSPEHVEEFLFISATWQHLHSMDPEKRIDLALLDVNGDSGAVLPFEKTVASAIPTATSAPRRQNWKLAAGAAVVLLAIATPFWLAKQSGNRTYATATGDQIAVKLPDGSVLHLNTRSRVEVHFDERRRDIKLMEGEALFVVERDPHRPFRVATDTATVQAVGTQFNVYRRDDGTRISVVDGVVSVTSDRTNDVALRLGAGDEADVTAEKVSKTAKPNISRAVAWRARRLVFQADRLEDVAREFNRYETRHPIRLEGKGIGARAVSGVFDADDPRPLVDFLRDDPQLIVTEAEHEIVIRER